MIKTLNLSAAGGLKVETLIDQLTASKPKNKMVKIGYGGKDYVVTEISKEGSFVELLLETGTKGLNVEQVVDALTQAHGTVVHLNIEGESVEKPQSENDVSIVSSQVTHSKMDLFKAILASVSTESSLEKDLDNYMKHVKTLNAGFKFKGYSIVDIGDSLSLTVEGITPKNAQSLESALQDYFPSQDVTFDDYESSTLQANYVIS